MKFFNRLLFKRKQIFDEISGLAEYVRTDGVHERTVERSRKEKA